MKPLATVMLAVCQLNALYATASHASSFRLEDDTEQGQLTLYESQTPVLTYNYLPQLADGVDKRYARSSYIHPLYDLDGAVLTKDFPKDHPHHHGVFWAWPKMKARGREVQLWMPDVLHHKFSRWVERKTEEDGGTIVVENDWILDGEERVGLEQVAIHVHPKTDGGRAIDIRLTVEAVGGPVELFGERYGGMNVRLTPEMKEGIWTTDTGKHAGDQIKKHFQWVDRSADSGIALIIHPDNHPHRWLLRSSYGAVICAQWPFREPHMLQPGSPVVLQYRFYVHRGDSQAEDLKDAYRQYVASGKEAPGAD